MLSRIPRTAYVMFVVLFGLAACTLPIRIPPPSIDYTPTIDRAAEAALATSIAATLTAQAIPGIIQPPPPTATPTPTETPTLTPSPTLSPTPEKTLISVSVDTNCRSGPGKTYDYIGALQVDETAEVFARDPSGNYWYIRNPDNPAGFCWVWGEYATISGITAGLPIYTPPPTPTPPLNFNVSYLSLDGCVGWFVEFRVKNTGGVTLESGYVKVKDQTTNTTVERTTDVFDELNACMTVSTADDLLPGEVGVLYSSDFLYNPTGNNLKAIITVCSQEGLGGTCITKTVNFTP